MIIFEILKKIWNLLSSREKIVACLLLLAMCFAAGLEILGIGLVIPVVVLLSKPELIAENKFLRFIHDLVEPSSNEEFIVT